MKCKCGHLMEIKALFEKRMFGLYVRKARWQCPKCKQQKTERSGAPAAVIRRAAGGVTTAVLN